MNDSFSIHSLLSADANFPDALRDPRITPPCSHIYYKGTLGASERYISIVGTRKPSECGKKFSYACAYALASSSYSIVSGLAYGIDVEAHRGALAAHGKTIAVLAHGLDTLYPPCHQNVADSILSSGGALISEYAAGVDALPHHFVQRNRIVAALAEAVVIIEAPEKSGSRITAMHALSYGKKVFVLPGDSSSSLYTGSHELIRKGARLISSVDHLFEDLNIRQTQHTSVYSLSENAEKIYAHMHALGHACSVDNILESTTLKPQEVQSALTELVLQGIITEEGVGRYNITGNR